MILRKGLVAFSYPVSIFYTALGFPSAPASNPASDAVSSQTGVGVSEANDRALLSQGSGFARNRLKKPGKRELACLYNIYLNLNYTFYGRFRECSKLPTDKGGG